MLYTPQVLLAQSHESAIYSHQCHTIWSDGKQGGALFREKTGAFKVTPWGKTSPKWIWRTWNGPATWSLAHPPVLPGQAMGTTMDFRMNGRRCSWQSSILAFIRQVSSRQPSLRMWKEKWTRWRDKMKASWTKFWLGYARRHRSSTGRWWCWKHKTTDWRSRELGSFWKECEPVVEVGTIWAKDVNAVFGSTSTICELGRTHQHHDPELEKQKQLWKTCFSICYILFILLMMTWKDSLLHETSSSWEGVRYFFRA